MRRPVWAIVVAVVGLLASASALPVNAAAEGEFREWVARLLTSYKAQDLKGAATALTRIATGWPQNLRELNVDLATRIAVDATSEVIGEQAHFEMLDALHRADFRASGNAVPEFLWFDLLHDLMARDQIERAREVAGQLVVPQFVIGMWADRRYDIVTLTKEQAPDIAPFVQKRIDRSKRAAEANPRSLTTQQSLCSIYISAGRYDDALKLATETLARIRAPGGDAIFRDSESQIGRMEGCEYEAHYKLGHWDFVEKTVRARADLVFNGKPWNDYLFDLAQFYVDAGRGTAALHVLDLPELQGEFAGGRLAHYRMVEHMAALQAGKPERAATALAALKAQRTDNRQVYMAALLDENDLAGAAAELVEMLRDENSRYYALYSLQDFTLPAQTERTRQWRERFTAMSARAEVRALIKEIGRLGKFAVPEN